MSSSGGRRWVMGLGVAAGLIVALGALLWLVQRRLIYIPFGDLPAASLVLPGAEEVRFDTADGLTLGGWFLPAQGPPTATVLVFNGNAGNRAFRAPLAASLAERGFAVLLMDYRGYGGNPGSPSEAGLIADARAARDWLASRAGVDPARIVYLGESLGAAVAVALATEAPPAALVLRSPFASMVDMGRRHYPVLPVRLLLRDRFPSDERIRRVDCPLLVVAGTADRIVPLESSRALYDASPSPRKRWLEVAGADHNDAVLLDGAPFVEAVTTFIEESAGTR